MEIVSKCGAHGMLRGFLQEVRLFASFPAKFAAFLYKC